MADNTTLPATGTGTANIPVATRSVTYSGDANQNVQVVGIGVFSGSDDAKTIADVGDADPLPIRSVGTDSAASTQVTVTNTSTTILSARATAPARRSALILNLQPVAVYIDASGGAATTSHFRLDSGAALTLEVTGAVTGITSAAYTATGDAKVHVIEVY